MRRDFFLAITKTVLKFSKWSLRPTGRPIPKRFASRLDLSEFTATIHTGIKYTSLARNKAAFSSRLESRLLIAPPQLS